jgi:hypothetical protein
MQVYEHDGVNGELSLRTLFERFEGKLRQNGFKGKTSSRSCKFSKILVSVENLKCSVCETSFSVCKNLKMKIKMKLFGVFLRGDTSH